MKREYVCACMRVCDGVSPQFDCMLAHLSNVTAIYVPVASQRSTIGVRCVR